MTEERIPSNQDYDELIKKMGDGGSYLAVCDPGREVYDQMIEFCAYVRQNKPGGLWVSSKDSTVTFKSTLATVTFVKRAD